MVAWALETIRAQHPSTNFPQSSLLFTLHSISRYFSHSIHVTMQAHHHHEQNHQKHNPNNETALHRKKRPCLSIQKLIQHNPPSTPRPSNDHRVNLMHLPTEIRLMILRYIIPSSIEPCVSSHFARLLEPWGIYALLTANKQLSAETSHLLYSEPLFAVTICRNGVGVLPPCKRHPGTLDPALVAILARVKHFAIIIRMDPARCQDRNDAMCAILRNVEDFVSAIRGKYHQSISVNVETYTTCLHLDDMEVARDQVCNVLDPFSQLARVRRPLLGAVHVSFRTADGCRLGMLKLDGREVAVYKGCIAIHRNREKVVL